MVVYRQAVNGDLGFVMLNEDEWLALWGDVLGMPSSNPTTGNHLFAAEWLKPTHMSPSTPPGARNVH